MNTKLSQNERFEVMALAFYKMTGHLAPGKDSSAASMNDREADQAAWAAWRETFGACCDEVIKAVEYVTYEGEVDDDRPSVYERTQQILDDAVKAALSGPSNCRPEVNA